MNSDASRTSYQGVIATGFALAVLSSFGQTFFVAISVSDVQREFAISHGGFGFIFSVATLASGILVIWLGAALDRVPARAFAVLSILGLAGAALLFAVAEGLLLLAAAVFGLRLFGQSMLSHAAVTSAARLPTEIRGRAIGMVTMGFAAGAALFPLIAIPVSAVVGWRTMWSMISVLLLACGALLLTRRREPPTLRASGERGGVAPALGLTRRDILRDARFLKMAPALLGPSAIGTGYLFHQMFLAHEHGWSSELLATAVSLSALASAASSLALGWLVDRLGAIRLSWLVQWPLAIGSIGLAHIGGPWAALTFFILLGMTSGANGVVLTAMLAEIYGVAQLGMIRSLAAAFMVIGSALSPGLMGLAFDHGIGLAPVGLVCAAFLAVASWSF